ncbi:hypothetical protein PR048_008862 [Dryococelus australis]|uniref:Uncharacterized protein n=1 Tax=Dryococelus australis TaxID=614101 RepID=A0ABQ9HYA8_9NEOP|nr:hypothetical protein PR048_008862 [Dryococelus australis]
MRWRDGNKSCETGNANIRTCLTPDGFRRKRRWNVRAVPCRTSSSPPPPPGRTHTTLQDHRKPLTLANVLLQNKTSHGDSGKKGGCTELAISWKRKLPSVVLVVSYFQKMPLPLPIPHHALCNKNRKKMAAADHRFDAHMCIEPNLADCNLFRDNTTNMSISQTTPPYLFPMVSWVKVKGAALNNEDLRADEGETS